MNRKRRRTSYSRRWTDEDLFGCAMIAGAFIGIAGGILLGIYANPW